MKFSGRNILISGGSKGIGLEIARSLASRGANVFLLARDAKALQKAKEAVLAANPAVRCEFESCDISDAGAVKRAVGRAVKTLGGLDGLISNAGFASPGYFREIPVADFEKTMAVDYLGGVYLAKEVLPFLKRGSFLSFTSSVVGFMGVFGYTSYAGPKFAIIGFAESLKQELDPLGIRVSVLCPPDTDTPGFVTENKTKPFETAKLSESAKLMSPAAVAEKFLSRLAQGKFLITVNFESWLFYRLHGIAPGLVRTIMVRMIAGIRKKRNR